MLKLLKTSHATQEVLSLLSTYQGLMRIDQGIDVVEKSSCFLRWCTGWSIWKRGCSWITLFIAMAPSLGFLGTVIGMVHGI